MTFYCVSSITEPSFFDVFHAAYQRFLKVPWPGVAAFQLYGFDIRNFGKWSDQGFFFRTTARERRTEVLTLNLSES